MTTSLASLEDQDWSQLQAAFGPATDVAGLLRDLISEVDARRADALSELYGTIWHQGTVYEATAFAVPYLTAIVGQDGIDDGTRAQVAVLLGCIAAATSFVLPENPRQTPWTGWMPEATEPYAGRDLAAEAQSSVAAQTPALIAAHATAPAATARALLAPLAAVATTATDWPVLHALAESDDHRLAAAARTLRHMVEDSLTEELLSELAATDDDAKDYLAAIPGWPLHQRGVELVRELVITSAGEYLT